METSDNSEGLPLKSDLLSSASVSAKNQRSSSLFNDKKASSQSKSIKLYDSVESVNPLQACRKSQIICEHANISGFWLTCSHKSENKKGQGLANTTQTLSANTCTTTNISPKLCKLVECIILYHIIIMDKFKYVL